MEGYAEYAGQAEQEIERVGLGTGDVFEVRVYGEEELSGVYRVAPDGTIDFPLIGEISVESRKPGSVARLLKKRLQEGYLRDPYVSVYVKEYNSHQVLVLGEVQKPGSFPYRGGMNVVEAIARAGGFKDTANGDHVVVTRTVDEAEERIPVPVSKISRGKAENLQLRAGDIVYVPASLL